MFGRRSNTLFMVPGTHQPACISADPRTESWINVRKRRPHDSTTTCTNENTDFSAPESQTIALPATRSVHPHSWPQPTKIPAFPHQKAKKPPFQQHAVSYNPQPPLEPRPGITKPPGPNWGRAAVAVALGFEPRVAVTPHSISSAAPSAARTRYLTRILYYTNPPTTQIDHPRWEQSHTPKPRVRAPTRTSRYAIASNSPRPPRPP